MARIFDVVEYPSEMTDELVHRFPEAGVADLRMGSQIIVREAQRAVFFRDGQALDSFGPGRHTITTANVPILTRILGTAFNDRTPFTAEVYYVSMKEFPDRKWGTPQPIIVKNPGMGLGVALIQAFGTYSFQVSDPQQFVTQIVGAQGVYMMADIETRLRTMLLSKIQDLLAETAKTASVLDLIGLTEEIGTGVRVKAQDDFAALGLTLKTFYIGSMKPSEKSAEELRAMGMLDMQTYTAQNPSGGAGLTAGIGAGMGIGNVINQSLQGMAGQANARGNAPQGGGAPGGAAPAGGVSDVMTPAEAAQVLRVSEEDVMAAIQSGDLKARKIGSAYRISKDALDNFLKGT